MENFGLYIYLASIADGVKGVAILLAICSVIDIVVCGILRQMDDVSSRNEKVVFGRWLKRGMFSFFASIFIILFVPSTKTCYHILGVSAATEIYQNSDALQQLPEKSIEALNRVLDSIASDSGEEEE